MGFAPNGQSLIKFSTNILQRDAGVLINRVSPSEDKDLLNLGEIGNKVSFDGEPHRQDLFNKRSQPYISKLVPLNLNSFQELVLLVHCL